MINETVEKHLKEAFEEITPQQKKAIDKYADDYAKMIAKEIAKHVSDNKYPSRINTWITARIKSQLK